MRTIAAAAAILAVAAAPAAAAPSLAPLEPCYVFAAVDPATGRYDAELIDVVATGFAPGTPLTVVVAGTTVASGVAADDAGSMRMQVQAPVQEEGEREFSISVSEDGDPANAATAASRVTHLEVRASPRTARPTRRITFRGRGFTDLDAPVYAHYVRRGRVRRTVRLVHRPAGPCGTFAVRRRQFPFRRPRVGRWSLYVDQSPVFRSELPAPQAELLIRVRRALPLRARRG